MTVRELGYEPYTGGRLGPMRRMLAITAVGIRIGLRRRFLVLAMLVAVPLTFLFGVLFYWAADAQADFLSHATVILSQQEWKDLLGPVYTRYDLWAVLMNRHLYYQMMWVLVVIPWVGPSLLSDDFQSGALTIYFSKPITRTEYLAGKWLVLAFFVGCVTVLPSTILYGISILLCRDLDVFMHTAYLVPAGWFLSLVVALSGGLMMMAFSAAGRSRRFAALGWLMTVAGGWAVATAVELAPREHRPVWVQVLSLKHDVDLLGRALFGVVQRIELPVLWGLEVLALVGVVSLLYVWRRVTTVEGLR